jgi:hypothetical protein
MHIKFWSENLKGRDHLEERQRWEDSIKMYLKNNEVRSSGLDSSGSGQGPVAGSCEHSNEALGSIKGKEFLDYLNDSF